MCQPGNANAAPAVPNILTVAGSDPSGGAGIQADIKAISANGGYAMAVIAALTAQNTTGVQHALSLPPDFVATQIASILADIRVDGVKIGMMADAATIEAVAGALAGYGGPVVLDPVMIAKGGHPLLDPAALEALRRLLMPLCTVLTPNLPEAAALTGLPLAETRDAMVAQAQALLQYGPRAVLIKGGHLAGGECPDLLMRRKGPVWIGGPRIATVNTHGTGCTLSSALATQMARSDDLAAAARAAKAYVTGAIEAASGLSVGQGHGPTDHFFMLRARVAPALRSV